MAPDPMGEGLLSQGLRAAYEAAHAMSQDKCRKRTAAIDGSVSPAAPESQGHLKQEIKFLAVLAVKYFWKKGVTMVITAARIKK